MSEQALARFVRPRVIDHGYGSGEPVRIEDAIERRLAEREWGTVFVEGPAGAGKRSALEYLRLAFGARPGVVVACGAPEPPDEPESVRVRAGAERAAALPRQRLELVPWTRDELIEYLLARHRGACASVMARLEAPDTGIDLKGRPLLWSAVLDELARDPSLASAFDGLRAAVRVRFSSVAAFLSAAEACWSALSRPLELDELGPEFRELARREPEAAPFLAQSSVHVLLAAECVTERLASAADVRLPRRLAGSLLRAARPLLCARPAARTTLSAIVAGERACASATREGEGERLAHASAASLLHLHGPTALAEVLRALAERGERLPRLAGAELEGLEAPGAMLRGAELDETRLAGARLDGADLSGARLNRADLRRASLCGAKLVDAAARAADLSGADLRGACLDGAKLGAAQLAEARLEAALLRRAELEGASLRGALLDRADLEGARLCTAILVGASLVDANLSGAVLDGVDLHSSRLATVRLGGASLVGCNLEGLELEGPDLSCCDLRDALLTGSRLPRADFGGAKLTGACLARVEWEGVNLREADLSYATFHLGSSRGGVLANLPGGFGTQTGFYADELREQSLRAPEEIRKANLRRADLRGARILDTDFYLVDLRGSLYTDEQRQHLRACGAIL